jgi:Domain of unknown function (DUF4124)
VEISAWVFFCLLAYSLPTEAQIYKWVDDKGTIHFSDRRPVSVPDAAIVQVIAEEARAPLVKNGPPPPTSDSEVQAYDPYDDMDEPELGDASERLDNEAGSPAVVVVEGARDPTVWFRAHSPRNRPGQAVRPRLRPLTHLPGRNRRGGPNRLGSSGSRRMSTPR